MLYSLCICNAIFWGTRCVVPPLRVLSPVVKFGRCFLKFPYQQMVMLVNDTELPGCYGVLPQVCFLILPFCCFSYISMGLCEKGRGISRLPQTVLLLSLAPPAFDRKMFKFSSLELPCR